MRSQRLHVGLTMLALAWTGLIVLTPQWTRPAVERGSGAGQSVAALVRMAGARVCHQRPDRSFHLHGQPLPVCGRCTGLYASGAVGLLVAGALGRRRASATASHPLPAWWPAGLDGRARWLAVAAVPTATTWALEAAGVWQPGTPLRALAAWPLGLVAGGLIGRTLDR